MNAQNSPQGHPSDREATRVRHRKMVFGCVAGCIGLVLAGCGSPDLAMMHPRVDKLAAEVWLVSPTPWNTQDVEQLGSNEKIVTKVDTVTSQQLMSRLQTSDGHPGLTVIASPSPLPVDVYDWVHQHVAQRVETITPTVMKADSVNLHQTVPDGWMAAYSLGALAGMLSTPGGNPAPLVGWISDTSASESSVDQQKTALAGLFSTNATVTLVPVPDLSQPVSGAFPRVVITARTLTNPEKAVLKSLGTVAISLVAQGLANPILAEPSLPGPEVVQDVFSRYADHSWKSGTSVVSNPPFAAIDSMVPGDIRSTEQSVELGVAERGADVQQAWKQLPQTVQQTWGAVAGFSR